MTGGPPSPTPGELTRGACVLEVLAPKAGNVHPQRSFDDTRWTDFVAAADAIEPIFDGVRERRVGETVLSSIRATREATGQNVNLGIVLLLAPLARVPTGADARAGVREILDTLDSDDCRDVFEAIALANPGGLGSSDESDVHEPPPDDLLAAMRLAADRDLVARQYAGGFDEVFQLGLPALQTALDRGLSLQDATVRLHLELMAEHPDSLIARKCGVELAQESARRARKIIDADWPAPAAGDSFARLDDWLRADGNRRNPGTSADLVAAVLFLALRAGIIPLPPRGSGVLPD